MVAPSSPLALKLLSTLSWRISYFFPLSLWICVIKAQGTGLAVQIPLWQPVKGEVWNMYVITFALS